MADRKITDFAAVTSLASGYIIPLVDLSEPNLIDQNKRASVAQFDARYLTVSGASVSGQLIVPSGTAAAPGLGVGEPDTGLYNPSNNTVGITTNGTSVFTINSSTATFAPAVTLSGTRAVFTTQSGTSALFQTVSGVLGVFTDLNATRVSTFFTVLSGSTASLTTVSGTNAVFTSNVQSLTFSGVNYQASSGVITNPAFAVGRADTGLYSNTLTDLNVTTAGRQIVRFSADGVTTFVGSGAVDVPVGTTAQRPSPSQGMIRFNTDRSSFEGYNGTAWTSVGGGATGSGTDEVFVLNQQVVSGTYTLPNGYNASSVGPITIASGVVVTVPSGSVWAVI